MRCLLLTGLFLLVSFASCRNLREEFTWTRISYQLNGDGYSTNSGNRFGRATNDKVELEERYGHSNRRPTYSNEDSYLSSESSGRGTSGVRGPTGNRGQNGNRGDGGNRGQSGRYGSNGSENWNQNIQDNYQWGNQNQGNNQNQENISNQETNQNQGNNQNQESTANLNDPNAPYIYQNNIPMGASPWRNKLFITVPRRRFGVPSSLNFVYLNNSNRHNVPLIPYPSLEMNSLPQGWQNRSDSCSTSSSNTTFGSNRIVSVYRVAVDPCNRLWIIDTGRIEIPGAPIQVAPPKLVIIDLNSDQVIQNHQFPDNVVTSASTIAHVLVDVTSDTCKNAYAYIPDVSGYGLVVYSIRENRSWRVTHNYFYLEPQAGEFLISGHNFQWNDGIFSTALSAPKSNGVRDLYFHSMAGTHLYSVSTNFLKNESLATRSYHGNDFKVVGDRGQLSQTSASALDENSGVLFFGLVNQNALGCWNVNNRPVQTAVVQKDDRRMIYPCDLKVYDGSVYLLTNTMPEFLYGQLNYDQTNFRIWIQTVQEAVAGTRCAGGRRGY